MKRILTPIRFEMRDISGWRDGDLEIQDDVGIIVVTEIGRYFIPWSNISRIEYRETK